MTKLASELTREHEFVEDVMVRRARAPRLVAAAGHRCSLLPRSLPLTSCRVPLSAVRPATCAHLLVSSAPGCRIPFHAARSSTCALRRRSS